MGYWETEGRSDEWYTPKFIFDALGIEFDLDVAAPEQGPLHVPAGRWLHKNSLETEWSGRIWMNPPFGGRNALGPWVQKFLEHGDGIALTPDRTSAPWFRTYARHADAILFIPKVRFIRPDGSEGKSPANGTALWASGAPALQALQRASKVLDGVLMTPVQNKDIP